MTVKIHPTAIVDSNAELGDEVEVGPFAIIESGVKVGARTKLWAHSYLATGAEIGEDCQIHMGAVVGHAPQDSKYKNEPTKAIIGNKVILREYVTVHRSNSLEENTVIGDECFLMVSSHVGHNCNLANKIIVANGAQIAGHVTIEDGAFISGNVVIHQFVRIGKLVMISGGSRIGMDVPPYLIADGTNSVSGLNSIGLRRSPDLDIEDFQQIKQAFKWIFRRELQLEDALKKMETLNSKAIKDWVTFYRAPNPRGYCRYKPVRRKER